MLQEASGAAGHPSYRRYHYGEGPLLVEDGGTRRFISTDALGSTTDLTTTGATVASMRKYDAWGQYRNDTAPLANEPKLGFTGHQYDPETGLVYARARYYDPDIGRFISRDSYEGSLSEAPSLHRYTYGQNNPLTYVDEDGHAVNLAAAGVGALIGGVGGCLVGAWSGGWEGCGKGALVGAGTGALAGLTFGASLAATGALGIGGTAVATGGTTGSVLVAGTMAGAVGGAASGAGNVLVNRGSATDALEAAENNAFLGAVGGAAGSAVAPWLGGAVVQSTGSQTLGKVGAGIAGAVAGDTAAQVTAVAGGIQQDFSGKQVAVAAAFGVGGALLPEGILTPRTRTAAPSKVVVEAGDAPTTVSLPARAPAEPKLLPARTATASAIPDAGQGVAPSATPTPTLLSGTRAGFIGTESGVAVHKSQGEMVDSILKAGATRVQQTGQTSEVGEIFRMDTPGGPIEIRVMPGRPGGGPLQGPRTVVTQPGTRQYVRPNGERIRQGHRPRGNGGQEFLRRNGIGMYQAILGNCGFAGG